MIRISQAILFGTIAVCLAAMIAFVGGWKLSAGINAMGAPAIVNPVPNNTEANTTSSDEDGANGSDSVSTNDRTPKDMRNRFELFWDVWELVDKEFYHTEPLDKQKMVYGAIKGMMQSLEDDYTSFEEPVVAERTRENMRGSFEGIGALLKMEDQELVIVRPLRKSPAIKAGIEAGDIVVAVDGEEIAPMIEGLEEREALDSIVEKIRGPQGSVVRLTIRRPPETETFDIEVERDRVPLISVNAQMIGDIAHVQITDFKDSTPDEFDTEMRTLLAQNPEGIVLDLRHNPGGIVNSSLRILGYFYEGTALYEDNSQGESKDLKTITDELSDDVRIPEDIPLVVLIDQRTASAAEIVAGALREERPNTTLLGQKSFGKGSVQNIHKLRDGSSARITIAHWFTPNRNEIHKVGIEPDYYVEASRDAEYAMPCIGDMIPAEGDEACNDEQLSWGVWYLEEGKIPPTPTPEAEEN